MLKGLINGVYYDPVPRGKCPDCKPGIFGPEPCKDHWEDEFFEDMYRYGH